MCCLFVVGNGFDIHHGLKTRYGDFAQYIQNKNPRLHELFSRFFYEMHKLYDLDIPNNSTLDDFVYSRWCDFEESLGSLDEEDYIQISQENISEYEEKIGMSEHRVGEFVSETAQILNVFRDWVSSIDIENYINHGFLFNKDTCFVNFNYTESLENIYGIDKENIFYIHGRRHSGHKLIVGHDTPPPRPASKHDLPDFQNNPFYGYLNLTGKPVDEINVRFKAWIDERPDIQSVTVCGHSLSYVDQKYFETIAKHNSAAEWRFSYYNDDDLSSINNLIYRLGLCESQIIAIAPMNEIGTSPLTKRKDQCASLLNPMDIFF